MTELVIGSDVYMVNSGRATKMPAFCGAMISRTIKVDPLKGGALADLMRSARDLGLQRVDGRSVHAYSDVVNGIPTTWYIDADELPVEAVIRDRRGKEVFDHTRYDQPISIRPPAS